MESQYFLSPVFCLTKEEMGQNQKVWTQPSKGGWVGHAPNQKEGPPDGGSCHSIPIHYLIPA